MKPTHVRIVTAPVVTTQATNLPEISVQVERRSLARRIWRTVAEDGLELGFDLSMALRHGEVVLVTEKVQYVVRQAPEPVLEIPVPAEPLSAAMLGWMIGNLHCAIEARQDCLVAADEGGLHLVLERAKLPFRRAKTVFQPATRAPASHSHLGASPGGQVPGDSWKESRESEAALAGGR